MDSNYYVYEWYDLNTDEVFYVGKGKDSRYKNTDKRNKFFKDFYNTHECGVRKIYENLSEKEAFKLEIETIKWYRENTTHRLTNQTDGGEGSSGVIVSQGFRDKMREIVMGENNPNYGNHWTEEQKEEAKLRFKDRDYLGENNPNFGNTWSENQRENLSKIRKGNPKYIKEKHGRAKKWIILETGDIKILKENIRKKILELPKIPTKYHYVEFNKLFLNDDYRIKVLLGLLISENKKSENFFIRDDKEIIYGIKALSEKLGIGIKKTRKIVSNKSKINIGNYTYYRIKNSPFVQ